MRLTPKQLRGRLQILSENQIICDCITARFMLKIASKIPPSMIREHQEFKEFVTWLQTAMLCGQDTSPFSYIGDSIAVSDVLDFIELTPYCDNTPICDDDDAADFLRKIICLCERQGGEYELHIADLSKVRHILTSKVL